MKEFLAQLGTIGISVGTIIIREIIAIILKTLKTPKEIRNLNKIEKHKQKMTKLLKKGIKENEKIPSQNKD